MVLIRQKLEYTTYYTIRLQLMQDNERSHLTCAASDAALLSTSDFAQVCADQQ